MNCDYCGKEINKIKRCKNVYCNKECSGLARRKNKSSEQSKMEKAEYDRQYRLKNKEILKRKKQEYFKKDYSENPEKYKEKRRKRYSKHLEYLNKPEYKAYKKQYDRVYRAKKQFGELWESHILLVDIESLIPNKEVKQQLNLINKSQKRKRNYESIKRKEFKRSPLGNIERS
jgi:hypothetical protein